MAEMQRMIPFLIYFETGVKDNSGVRDDKCANELLFERAKAKGITTDPDDRGGATLVGITYSTYSTYSTFKASSARKPTAVSLKRFRNMSYQEWLEILKTMFWDRWHADEIQNQEVAEMLVDWVWTSGKYGITIPQQMLGVKTDGIVGRKTLNAVNSLDGSLLFPLLKHERLAYIDRICRSRPANSKFRNGWIRRINAIPMRRASE